MVGVVQGADSDTQPPLKAAFLISHSGKNGRLACVERQRSMGRARAARTAGLHAVGREAERGGRGGRGREFPTAVVERNGGGGSEGGGER